jgi:hypothetical protein
MLATPTTGLLPSARVLLPRAICGQAQEPGTGRPATPPEQGSGWGRPTDEPRPEPGPAQQTHFGVFRRLFIANRNAGC